MEAASSCFVPKTEPLLSNARAADAIYLLGLDFGSTTTSALVARATLVANSVTGHMALGNIQMVYRSPVIFTPFVAEQIDEGAITHFLASTLNATQLTADDFMAGGAIITGLAARAQNAAQLTKIIEAHVGEVLIATADDPALESWLAFMGSCGALSRFYHDKLIVNLDIGGGTTNPACGLNGSVLSSGCYFLGARHFQFTPGSYQITALTLEAKVLLQNFAIHKGVGDVLLPEERQRIMGFYVLCLEKMVAGVIHDYLVNCGLATLEQVAFTLPLMQEQICEITFSGGVGELVYQFFEGQERCAPTYYGDFGGDLAEAILASPVLSRSLTTCVPEHKGRATVYGLALHSTEVSGTTLYLPRESVLPLKNLPIIGQLAAHSDSALFRQLLTTLLATTGGGCLQILFADAFAHHVRLDVIRETAAKIRQSLQALNPQGETPIVLLVDENIAKSFGSYITNWGTLTFNVVVIDEVALREASFVNIGRPYRQVVPITLYGMQ